MRKLAQARFYVDADILGLAHILCSLRNDVTYPGFVGGDKMFGRWRQACTIQDTETDDEVWIKECAQRGWLIITRDSKIQERTAEISAVREHGARMVVLTGSDAGTTWNQLDIVMRRWSRIEALLAQEGPFIYSISRTTWRQVPLERPAPRRPRPEPLPSGTPLVLETAETSLDQGD